MSGFEVGTRVRLKKNVYQTADQPEEFAIGDEGTVVWAGPIYFSVDLDKAVEGDVRWTFAPHELEVIREG